MPQWESLGISMQRFKFSHYFYFYYYLDDTLKKIKEKIKKEKFKTFSFITNNFLNPRICRRDLVWHPSHALVVEGLMRQQIKKVNLSNPWNLGFELNRA